ncbi:MAG: cytidylate kinase family protein [Magnetococcales bacterium]|nr:cytidylate kinase family protein [Magnetococcales bacterium]
MVNKYVVHMPKPKKQKQGIVATQPLVMVSGPFGSGMGDLAARLAETLKVQYYNPHKLEELASDKERHKRIWQELQASEGDFFDYWLGHIYEQPGITPSEHLERLTTTIHEIAREGGVVAGICPHIVLPGDKLVRIQVKADAKFCANRLAKKHGIDENEAKKVFTELESQRQELMHTMFEDVMSHVIQFDLVMDAEKLSSKKMLKLSLELLEKRHLIPKDFIKSIPEFLMQI